MPDSAAPAAAIALAGVSGAAAIAYEAIFFRFGLIHFGVSYPAFATIVLVFMLGNAAGALGMGWVADRSAHRLRLYVGMELALAAVAAFSPALFDLAARLAADLGTVMPASNTGQLGARALALVVALFLPTFLMGGFFPVFGGYLVAGTPNPGSRYAALYGAYNLCGALAALIVGVTLSPQTHLHLLVRGVAGLHALALLPAVFLASRTGPGPASVDPEARRLTAPSPWSAPALVGLGALFIGFENIAYRAGTLTRIHAYDAAFPYILFLALVGVALGGVAYHTLLASRWSGQTTRLVLAGACAAAVLTSLGTHLGDWPAASLDLVPMDQRSLYERLAAALPFPPLLCLAIALFTSQVGLLICRAYACAGDALTGRSIARTYGWLTAGAIIGTFVPGQVLFSAIGLAPTLALLALALAGVLAWSALRARASAPASRWYATALALAAAPLGLQLAFGTHYRAFAAPGERMLFHHDGAAVSTLVTEGAVENGQRSRNLYHLSGLQSASSRTRPAQLIPLLPRLMRPESEHLFLIGYAIGRVSRKLLDYPAVQSLTVADLDESVPLYDAWFEPWNQGVLGDPRVSLHVGDGRHILAASEQAYDAVVVDVYGPEHAQLLYTRQFLAIAREHLRPGGVVALKVFGASDRYWERGLPSVVSTVGAVFEHYAIWWGGAMSKMIMVVGSDAPFRLDAQAAVELVQRDSSQVSPEQVAHLLCGFVADDEESRDLLADYPPLDDLRFAIAGGRGSRRFLEAVLLRRLADPTRAIRLTEGLTGSQARQLEPLLRECWASSDVGRAIGR